VLEVLQRLVRSAVEIGKPPQHSMGVTVVGVQLDRGLEEVDSTRSVAGRGVQSSQSAWANAMRGFVATISSSRRMAGRCFCSLMSCEARNHLSFNIRLKLHERVNRVARFLRRINTKRRAEGINRHKETEFAAVCRSAPAPELSERTGEFPGGGDAGGIGAGVEPFEPHGIACLRIDRDPVFPALNRGHEPLPLGSEVDLYLINLRHMAFDALLLKGIRESSAFGAVSRLMTVSAR